MRSSIHLSIDLWISSLSLIANKDLGKVVVGVFMGGVFSNDFGKRRDSMVFQELIETSIQY